MALRFFKEATLAGILAASVLLAPAGGIQHGSVEELVRANFDKKVLSSSLPAAVEFYADWCGSCREMRPVYEKICRELSGKLYCAAYNVDQDDEGETGPSFAYGVREIPAVSFFCHRRHDEGRKLVGTKTEKELRQIINDFANSCR